MIRIGVLGNGLMGKLVAEEIEAAKDVCELAGIATRDPGIVRKLIAESHVVVDFTGPEATPGFARVAAKLGTPFMSGTTGLSAEGMESLKQSTRRIPLFHAPNTSRSFAEFDRTIERVTRRMPLDMDYTVEILDEHHVGKSPEHSGSALLLDETIRKASGGRFHPDIKSVRRGDTVGKHTVTFTGAGEITSYFHAITDRRIFARGALHATLWLRKKGPGLYGMKDLLCL